MDGHRRHEGVQDHCGDDERGRNGERNRVHARRGRGRPQGDLDPVGADRERERDQAEPYGSPDACRLPRLG
jgi:hypothetical protein